MVLQFRCRDGSESFRGGFLRFGGTSIDIQLDSEICYLSLVSLSYPRGEMCENFSKFTSMDELWAIAVKPDAPHALERPSGWGEFAPGL